jgi:glutamate--cysteine ligase
MPDAQTPPIASSADKLAALAALSDGFLRLQRGIERETLRTDGHSKLSLTPHPSALGHKLTHPSITTDFSESQLELITPVHQTVDTLLQDLRSTHLFVARAIGHERLWAGSMPCVLPAESMIPLADYGNSNLGRLKKTYRRGLGMRYNRIMQTICAVHYNFSLPQDAWDALKQVEGSEESEREYIARRYFDLMRNFRRWSWLPLYLFGASPAVDRSFLKDSETSLFERLDDDTFYLPFATSLRSGDLGYQSHIQSEQINICYNSLLDYTDTLRDAITTPHEPYESLSQREGRFAQISTHTLQSEAEFYTTVRAKAAAPSGDNFIEYLRTHGPDYIEVRLLDVNPFLDIGINAEQIHFLDLFLMHCLLSDSPPHDPARCSEVQTNFKHTVREGRRADATLQNEGHSVRLKDWANTILDDLAPLAAFMDRANHGQDYAVALSTMRHRIENPDATPSGKLLQTLSHEGQSLRAFITEQSEHFHRGWLESDWSAVDQSLFEKEALDSIAAAEAYKPTDDDAFEHYLNDFVSGYQHRS